MNWVLTKLRFCFCMLGNLTVSFAEWICDQNWYLDSFQMDMHLGIFINLFFFFTAPLIFLGNDVCVLRKFADSFYYSVGCSPRWVLKNS